MRGAYYFGRASLRRLIQDAGSEPGSLPLLAFALEQLFKRRSGNVLSEDVYTRIRRYRRRDWRSCGRR